MEKSHTDVLILGCGAAGIRAAISACETGARVMLVAQEGVTDRGSTFSKISNGWGIQALLAEERTEKNLESFFEDISRVGLEEHSPKLVRILVEESGLRLEDLISYGIAFRRDSQGDLLRARGCFSHTRRAFVTANIGNIKQSFLSIHRRPSVRIMTGDVIDLVIAEGACWGAWIRSQSGEILQIEAKATVLATGGGAGIYQHHVVDDEQIGAGYALAHRAGAKLVNLEFVQFMLGLKENGIKKILPIAKIKKPKKILNQEKEDLIQCYIPESSVRQKAIHERQTHMPFSCRDTSYQIDLAIALTAQTGQKIVWQGNGANNRGTEVVHFAHAFNGGLLIDETAESTIEGLFAAGEVAAGPHGADRIGGCMMTATQVFGQRAGHFAAKRVKRITHCPRIEVPQNIAAIENHAGPDRAAIQAVETIQSRVKLAMGKYAAVLRSQKSLCTCSEILDTCNLHLEALGTVGIANLNKYLNVRNLILTANLVVQSALARKESKGPHFREDAPDLD